MVQPSSLAMCYLRWFIPFILTVIANCASAKDNIRDSVKLKLVYRIQSKNAKSKLIEDVYDPSIYSPKSVLILEKKSPKKEKILYINNLEGHNTAVYSLTDTLKKITNIRHSFDDHNAGLFTDSVFPGYTYVDSAVNVNVFHGKPVEMCLSNDDKFLWIPYYRRSFDKKSVDPSALALIDVETNSIVRVFPTAPLPKMVASSNDNKYVAVTNWGDNTVHLMDVSSGNPMLFKYSNNFVVDSQLKMNFKEGVNRDNDCGFCLRGTTFTPDSKHLLVSRMGGGGIAVFDMDEKKYEGTVFGTKDNIRHIVIDHGFLYLSSNLDGHIQQASLDDFLNSVHKKKKQKYFGKWRDVFTGHGARTFCLNSTGEYLFATANIESKISIVRTSDMTKIGEVATDSYPVGMAIDSEDKYLIVTAQGKKGVGGNCVSIYKITIPTE